MDEKINTNLLNKIKLFTYLVTNLDIYIKNKKEKDAELNIDKIQKRLITEILKTEKLKKLIIFKCEEQEKELPLDFTKKETKLNFKPKTSQVKLQDLNDDTDNKIAKRKENSTCFGQRTLKMVRMCYNTRKEAEIVKEQIEKYIKALLNRHFEQRLNTRIVPDDNRNIVLTHVHKNESDNMLSTFISNGNSIGYTTIYMKESRKNINLNTICSASPVKKEKDSITRTTYKNVQKLSIDEIINKFKFKNFYSTTGPLPDTFTEKSKTERVHEVYSDKERKKNLKLIYSNILSQKNLILAKTINNEENNTIRIKKFKQIPSKTRNIQNNLENNYNETINTLISVLDKLPEVSVTKNTWKFNNKIKGGDLNFTKY